ncbi:MAG: hypothetical protein ACKPKO_57745, partial [Candidatus Fonsibacter sp.]
QPWISEKENNGVCGGFGIGCKVCCRMLGREEPLFLRTEMATLYCTNPRKDALKKHQTSEQHDKSVLEELGNQVGQKLPLEVFSEVFSTLQSG